METHRDLDEVLADLVAATQELESAPSIADRVRLRGRLNELRSEAAALRGSAPARVSDRALRARIAYCDRVLGGLRAARFDPSMVGFASGRGGGLDPVQTVRHNTAIDEAGGRDALESERVELLAELARRSGR